MIYFDRKSVKDESTSRRTLKRNRPISGIDCLVVVEGSVSKELEKTVKGGLDAASTKLEDT